MLASLALRLRLTRNLPTVDYYFRDAMAADIGWRRSASDIQRIGPHTFASRDRLVVVRYANDRELDLLIEPRWRQVFYVIDDMLPIAATCDELPVAYRQRLARFADMVLPRILAGGPQIVAPRREILDLFPDHAGLLLDPSCMSVATDGRHFDDVVNRGATSRHPLRAAFLGTRSHGAGLDFLADVALTIERRRLPVQITCFLGPHAPASLAASKVVDNRKGLSWSAFRAMMLRERFHVILAPLPDTPFNRGRSITKLLDAAAFGATGLYSDRNPFREHVADGLDGLLLADDADVWSDAIERLVMRPELARDMAAAGAGLARRIGDPARVRAFWRGQLMLDQSSDATQLTTGR